MVTVMGCGDSVFVRPYSIIPHPQPEFIMKNQKKHIFAALAVIALASGSFLIAQTAPAVSAPAPAAGSAGERGGAHGSPRFRTHQVHMNAALTRLKEARNQLDAALDDKGGMKMKAIASVDQAIRDVQAGIDYAEAHQEEFAPEGRGRREGEPGREGGSGREEPAVNAPVIHVPGAGG